MSKVKVGCMSSVSVVVKIFPLHKFLEFQYLLFSLYTHSRSRHGGHRKVLRDGVQSLGVGVFVVLGVLSREGPRPGVRVHFGPGCDSRRFLIDLWEVG